MSDRSAQPASEMVIGTAGHIDHGKTSLVRALTGVDTDRLAEEKRRGISIDLGFAHTTLLDGQPVSFVDVPGHERFVKNMLAGAAGIEAVLLVIAADEGVKPQTREHFDICRLLGIQRGVVVLTKTDIASPDQLASATETAEMLCAGSFLENAPIVGVSAVTGEGIEQLKDELSKLANGRLLRSDHGLPRLPLDRSFAVKGFGTVVTGTLWSGQFRIGEIVQIYPTLKTARIRGLQTHGNPVEIARAGQRTAVNLAGIDHAEIQRGFVLSRPNTFAASNVIDLLVNWLDDGDIPLGRAQFLYHSGTAELSSTLKVLSHERNKCTFARLWLSGPVVTTPGDRFVLRLPSPARTVAGGSIIDAFPPKRLSRSKTVARLQKLAIADLPERILLLTEESRTGRQIEELVRLVDAPPETVKTLIGQNPQLVFIEGAQRVVTKLWLQNRRDKLLEWLRAFHAKNPSVPGAPVGAARLGLEPSLAAAVFDGVPEIRTEGDLIALADHQIQFTDQETRALSRTEQIFRAASFQPPALMEVLKMSGLDLKKGRALLEVLIKQQRLVRVSEELVFHADAIAHIRKTLAAYRGRRFSVPEFKDWTQISRKYAIPLLEYLDRQRVTRREGDSRLVL